MNNDLLNDDLKPDLFIDELKSHVFIYVFINLKFLLLFLSNKLNCAQLRSQMLEDAKLAKKVERYFPKVEARSTPNMPPPPAKTPTSKQYVDEGDDASSEAFDDASDADE